MHLNRVTWLVVLAAGLSLAADVIEWAWFGRSVITAPELTEQYMSAMEWLNILGPSAAWLLENLAASLWLFAVAAWVEALSRIHRRLRVRNAVQFEG